MSLQKASKGKLTSIETIQSTKSRVMTSPLDKPFKVNRRHSSKCSNKLKIAMIRMKAPKKNKIIKMVLGFIKHTRPKASSISARIPAIHFWASISTRPIKTWRQIVCQFRTKSPSLHGIKKTMSCSQLCPGKFSSKI